MDTFNFNNIISVNAFLSFDITFINLMSNQWNKKLKSISQNIIEKHMYRLRYVTWLRNVKILALTLVCTTTSYVPRDTYTYCAVTV